MLTGPIASLLMLTAALTPTHPVRSTAPLTIAASIDQIGTPKRVVTPELLLSPDAKRESLGSNLSWIPGTDSILVPVKVSESEGTWIEEININSAQRKRLVKSDSAFPSPDGTKIAYISGQSGKNQIWVVSRDGSDAKQITEIPAGLSRTRFCCWSPDSRSIAYTAYQYETSPPRKPNDEIKASKETSTVVLYNRKSTTQIESKSLELWTTDLSTGVQRKVTTVQAEACLGLSWSSDGGTIYLSWFDDPDTTFGAYETVAAVSVTTGDSRPLIDRAVADSLGGSPSPDSKSVAFLCSDYHGGYWHNWQIAFAPVQGGAVRRLSKSFKCLGFPQWSVDGKHITTYRRDGVHDQVLLMDIEGKVSKTIHLSGTCVGGVMPTVSRDGRLAWVEIDWQGRKLLQTATERDAKPRTVVNFSPEIDSLTLGDTEVIDWESHDHVKNSGVLVKPVGYTAGKAYPLLVDLHGGPSSGVYPGGFPLFDALQWQMWAQKGYVVLAPEYRISGNYGFNLLMKERARGTFFDGDFDDIMSGVDHLISTGLVDPKKMAVLGHSYGGVETDWIITHTHRFQAAIAYEGYSDFYDVYAGRGIPNRTVSWQFEGTPNVASDKYKRNSAMFFAGDVTTPTLFINADQGINARSEASMYISLTDHGVDTQYLVYKGEGHVVSKPVNQRNLLYWCINWVDTHLGFAPTPDPKAVFDVADLQTATAPKREAKR